MFYLFLKYIHILSSTILFGTGIGTATIMVYAHQSRDVPTIAAIAKYVVLADWCFTATSGFLQPLTGLWLIYLAGFSLKAVWLYASIAGYLIAAFCWFPVVYLQIKMRDCAFQALEKKTALPLQYYRYYKIWFYLGWPAFISLIIVFYLMVNKPI
jgi:uncharacterized membrane protein